MTEQSSTGKPGARHRISEAVIAVLATDGLARLTHRRVAQAAGTSLAATTYHYKSKRDMIDDASARLLREYIEAFEALSGQYRSGQRAYRGIEDLVFRLIRNVATRERRNSHAWGEIIIDAARTEEGRELARGWFDRLLACWKDMLSVGGEELRDSEILAAIDMVIGMIFVIHGLALSQGDVEAIWRGERDIAAIARPAPGGLAEQGELAGYTPKARATRSSIVDGAIQVLMREGAGALSYRAVAEATGVAQTAPAYYFGSIVNLLREAEIALFRRSKQRYRDMVWAERIEPGSADQLADLTSAIFIREATEFAPASVAHYSIWLEAARRPEFRREVAEAVVDQTVAWRRRLEHLGTVGPVDGLRLQALFIGHLVRTIACGTPAGHISRAREEFAGAIAHGLAGNT